MRSVLLLALLLVVPRLDAADDPKQVAALSLHRSMMAVDASALVDAAMSGILRQTGNEFPPAVQAEMKKLLTEVVTSEEYANAKAKVFAATFTLEELQKLQEMIGSPIYRKYQSVLPQLTKDSAQRLNELIAAKQPMIQQRLQQVWDSLGAR
jgi:ADP-ribosylglycohydrolase